MITLSSLYPALSTLSEKSKTPFSHFLNINPEDREALEYALWDMTAYSKNFYRGIVTGIILFMFFDIISLSIFQLLK